MRLPIPALLAALPAAFSLAAGTVPAQTPDSADAVDRVFARWNTDSTPGCAVGVALSGRTLLTRSYGMSDLERSVRSTPATIYESGSVAKQFTAAAVLLLAQDGKLSLDDDVRKHLPELPDYGAPITLRHMLNHTSGLRDWGVVAGAGGWPRGSRNYTQTHVLDISRRQRALNFPTASEYSYSNTNYNLLAIIVARTAGISFGEFTRRRLFEPLGMTSTSWRDDHQRLVRNRAQAYSGNGPFRLDMPNENAHGNGGLLTTVEDLLRWNENFTAGTVGGPGFRTAMERKGILTSRREITYALGLLVDDRDRIPYVYHTGSTAGYRAYLGRYPEQRLSVAILCNHGSANPNQLGNAVADVFLPAGLRRPSSAPAPALKLTAAQLAPFSGLWRNARTYRTTRVTVTDGKLRIAGGPELIPLSRTAFALGASGIRMEFERVSDGGRPHLVAVYPDGFRDPHAPVPDFAPAAERLREYTGTFASDEVEASYTIAVSGQNLVARDRYGAERVLAPQYPDVFQQGGSLVRFLRDGTGRVTEMSLSFDRARDLRFRRAE